MTAPSKSDDDLAELADLVLNVARLLRAHTPEDTGAIALTDTERHVMRIVDLYPECAPSEIAQRAQMQRTNVSTALRNLETKGMITRRASNGRGVAVTPTRLAATNIAHLRTAWSHQLKDAVRQDLDAVRQCNQLLSQIEHSLTSTNTD